MCFNYSYALKTSQRPPKVFFLSFCSSAILRTRLLRSIEREIGERAWHLGRRSAQVSAFALGQVVMTLFACDRWSELSEAISLVLLRQSADGAQDLRGETSESETTGDIGGSCFRSFIEDFRTSLRLC